MLNWANALYLIAGNFCLFLCSVVLTRESRLHTHKNTDGLVWRVVCPLPWLRRSSRFSFTVFLSSKIWPFQSDRATLCTAPSRQLIQPANALERQRSICRAWLDEFTSRALRPAVGLPPELCPVRWHQSSWEFLLGHETWAQQRCTKRTKEHHSDITH